MHSAGSGVAADSVDAELHAERELVERLRANDPAAYELLVRRHTASLLAVTRRLLGNEEDARDALQDAFLSAFRALPAFEGGARLATWLHRIAINAALMKLRQRRRKNEESIEPYLPGFQEDGHQAHPAVPWGRPAQEILSDREDRAFVRACIDRLPETYRTVLLLRDIEELSTQETAEALGIEPNAVKVRLHRARQALRTLLDERLRESP